MHAASELIFNFVLNAVLADRRDLCRCRTRVVVVEEWPSALPAHVVGCRTHCLFSRTAVDCNAVCARCGFRVFRWPLLKPIPAQVSAGARSQ